MFETGAPQALLALLIPPLLGILQDDEEHPEEPGAESQIRWLRSMGDREALFQIMQHSAQLTQGLDAAEALVELGDVRGLDHLIATLDSSSSFLRQQAAQITKRLGHPRGLRALRDHAQRARGKRSSPPTLAGSQAAQGGRLFEDLNRRQTDELVALWHERERARWPDDAIETLEALLKSRLGELPRQARSAEDTASDIDESVDPSIRALWARGDQDGLTRLFADALDTSLQLQAAEALADLGDGDALDVLIEALDDADPNIGDVAAGMLDWLDLPRGNDALRDRGIEFEADTAEEPDGDETAAEVAENEARGSRPASQSQSLWQLPSTTRSAWPAASSAAAPQTASRGTDAGAGSYPVTLLTGAIGGLIGHLVFLAGLHILGILALPADLGGWLIPSRLSSMAAAMAAGALLGPLGSRLGRRSELEPAEGDLIPVIGALLAAAVAGIAADLVLFVMGVTGSGR